MPKLQALPANALSEGIGSPGIARHIAFQGQGFVVMRARSDPGAVSGWHHHGDYDVYGYVASGTGRFESQGGDEDALILGPGDFFHVPPHTVHREINPSPSEGNELVLFLHGSGPTVFNVGERGQL